MSHTAPTESQTLPQDDPNVTTPPAPPAPPAAAPTGSYSEADFLAMAERVRQEEREKLSVPQQELAARLAALEAAANEAREAREKVEADARAERAQREAAEKAKREEEMSFKELLAAKEQEWNARVAQLEEQNRAREALFNKERERAELVAYIHNQVDANRDKIAPELIGYVNGGTKQEVDASIATAIANTSSILEGIRQAQQSARAAIPGISPTAGNTGPLEQQDSTRTFSAEEIAAMPVNSPEYQQLRAQAGIAGAGRGKGMFQ